jgi:hypothetical protein
VSEHSVPGRPSLGRFLVATSTGWQPWFDAEDAIVLGRQSVALDASAAVLEHLGELPRRLRGLSLAGLPVTDEHLAVVVRRAAQLHWLDLRGTRVSSAGLARLRRLRRLRILGLDQQLLAADPVRHRPGLELTAGDAELVPLEPAAPAPDVTGFNDLLAAAVRANPGVAGSQDAEATTRAVLLLDADRPETALAVLAPLIAAADPDLLVVAARCVNELGTPRQALAALALGAPSTELLAWRAVFLARSAPAEAVLVARAALREDPANATALWAVCSAYLNAGQLRWAERALAQIEAERPESADAARLGARLARAKGKFRQEAEAWRRLLVLAPDDADALAGLARAQRSARPLSMAWVKTLNAAATADVEGHGGSLLEQVTGYRRAVSWGFGVATAVVLFGLGGTLPWFIGRSIGWPIAVGVLVGNLVAVLLWCLTPGSVRTMIRRSDDLTGRHRRPKWRWTLAGLVAAAAVVFVPVNLPEAPDCGGRYQAACPTVKPPVINLPTFTIPPIVLPTFSFPSSP